VSVPEFSRLRRLDTLGAGEIAVEVEADAAERAALAARFGLLALDSLAATYRLHCEGADVIATGRLDAAVTQACVATGAPVPATIAEDFAIRFTPEIADAPDEAELDEGDLDTMFYTGGAVDLGEAAAETLALALDPFPRAEGAAQVLAAAGVKRDDEVQPSGPLAGLRDLLSGKD
jgi:uncharacterized metal-binding protein YceD (DUF177 family)